MSEVRLTIDGREFVIRKINLETWIRIAEEGLMEKLADPTSALRATVRIAELALLQDNPDLRDGFLLKNAGIEDLSAIQQISGFVLSSSRKREKIEDPKAESPSP